MTRIFLAQCMMLVPATITWYSTSVRDLLEVLEDGGRRSIWVVWKVRLVSPRSGVDRWGLFFGALL